MRKVLHNNVSLLHSTNNSNESQYSLTHQRKILPFINYLKHLKDMDFSTDWWSSLYNKQSFPGKIWNIYVSNNSKLKIHLRNHYILVIFIFYKIRKRKIGRCWGDIVINKIHIMSKMIGMSEVMDSWWQRCWK